MPKPPRRETSTPAPDRAFDVADPRPPSTYEPSHVVQSLVEIQKDISHLSAKTDRLIGDVEKLDKEVDALRISFSRAQGFGLAAIILIPICAAIVWWLVGDKLNELKTQILMNRPPQTTSQPMTPPQKP